MKVLITRPFSQSGSFGSALQQAGFDPVYFPVIEIRPANDLTALDRALADIQRYSWLVFTSVNAVEIVFQHLQANAKDAPALFGGLKIAAIGPKTAQSLRQQGIEPAFTPDEFVAEAIFPGLGDLSGQWVLLPRAEIARKALPEAIADAGGNAHEITVYHTLPAQIQPAGLAALQAGVDWLTFTSPSTVHNFVQIVHSSGLDPLQLPGNPQIACIGPITEQAARQAGFGVDVVAETYTTEGLIEAISKDRIQFSGRLHA